MRRGAKKRERERRGNRGILSREGEKIERGGVRKRES